MFLFQPAASQGWLVHIMGLVGKIIRCFSYKKNMKKPKNNSEDIQFNQEPENVNI